MSINKDESEKEKNYSKQKLKSFLLCAVHSEPSPLSEWKKSVNQMRRVWNGKRRKERTNTNLFSFLFS